MARRKSNMTEAELLAEKERIEQQLVEVREKENTELGALLKKTFGDLLPVSKSGRNAFFKEWKEYLEAKHMNNVSSVNENMLEGMVVCNADVIDGEI